MAFLLAALTLGFLGSFHCVGMCGPIALSLPTGQSRGLKKIILVFSYNLGRVFTYSVFGLFAGLIGKSFVISGYQQILSVTLGTAILVFVFISAYYQGTNKIQSKTFSLFSQIKTFLGKLFLKNGHGPLFLIGLLNGLLPCGLVYMGLAGAMATGNILNGALFMAIFGLGTAPVMLFLPLAGKLMNINARNKIRKIVPLFAGFMAVLLILRGLNLGIPYVSPKIKNSEVAVCHTTEFSIPTAKLIHCSPHKNQAKK